MLRIFAGTCALLWLVGIALSGMGRVCNCAGHGGACAVHASPVHEHDGGGAPQGHHCCKNGCEKQCRCSATIQGLVQTPPAVVILKPASQPVLNISLLRVAREHVFIAAKCESVRPAKPRDWVFIPEVCLGPAFRSHAPPPSV